ncbi:hypothetical protein [Nocardia sp. SSK8]|uniref:hypothetical protein n=1 Tax=Nocardia sp. SSK8 TaxID=3120154 RepID=UPI00300A8877
MINSRTIRSARLPAALATCSLAAAAATATLSPMATAQPAADPTAQAVCVAQTTLTPGFLGLGLTARDTITCTDAAGSPLISGHSELTIEGSACGDATTTSTTYWDDGTRTVTETTGTISADDRTYAATGTVTADSTRFAGAEVTVVGTGVEPSCENPLQPAAAAYLVTFHK